MIRRLNYTGRKKILREDVRIAVTRRERLPSLFKATLSLADYDLPADARVFIEAYRQTTWMRFDAGTVAIPSQEEFELVEFGEPDGVLFRVRVRSPRESDARVLAEADQISGATEGESAAEPRESLLPVKGEDLDDLVWALETDPRPLLKINSRLGNWRAVARHPAFEALVLPAALRLILKEAVGQEGADAGDAATWWGQWLRYASRLPGAPEFDPDRPTEDQEEWIDETVRAFSRSRETLKRFASFFEEEDAA